MKIWAGFNSAGRCVAASSGDVKFLKEKGLEVKFVEIDEAMKSASDGFKRSLRYLKTSIENRNSMESLK